jgi:uncharacterized protein (DUF885 family)
MTSIGGIAAQYVERAATLAERIWLQAREEAKARAGGTFSLKDFHAKALSLGVMGLDPLREALAGL